MSEQNLNSQDAAERAAGSDGGEWRYNYHADCPDCKSPAVIEHVDRGILECKNCLRRGLKDEWYDSIGEADDGRLSYREFIDHCLENEQEQQDRQYILGQSRRFYNSYDRLVDILAPGDTILSAGIGSGYLETAIARTVDVEILGADFEQSIRTNQAFLDDYGIRFIPTDLTDDDPFPDGTTADVVVSTEVIEHLPQPPQAHVRKLAGVLNPGGTLYLTTPNAVKLRNISRMLLGDLPLPPAEKLFSPVGPENEGVHRRPYTRDEMAAAIKSTGLGLVDSGYEFRGDHCHRDWKLWLLYPLEWLVPRFRPTMFFMARAAGNTPESVERVETGRDPLGTSRMHNGWGPGPFALLTEALRRRGTRAISGGTA